MEKFVCVNQIIKNLTKNDKAICEYFYQSKTDIINNKSKRIVDNFYVRNLQNYSNNCDLFDKFRTTLTQQSLILKYIN